MKKEELVDYCNNWLAAWTGNNPEVLITFYSEDSYYQDPANSTGLKGHNQLLPYFKKLLAVNPHWKWEAEEIYPTKKGCILKWKATIPIGSKIVIEHGMDIVEIKEGQIIRNEVYFDRTKMLSFLDELRKK